MEQKDLDRFWSKVRKTEGCWEWTSTKWWFGHGRFKLGKRDLRAHRVAWQIYKVTPPPSNLHVLHTCDNPSCVREEHLYLGTQADNMRDRSARWRSPGMLLSAEDIYYIRSTSEGNKDLAERFGVDRSTISRARTGDTYRHA